MENEKKQIKLLIEQFENGKIDAQTAIEQINELAEAKISYYELISYTSYTDQDAFIEQITKKTIENWQEIDDKKAILLIEEMLQNLADIAIIGRNSEALEKRYGKPTGKVSDYIFYEAIITSQDILMELKKDTKIYL
jgi:hypothetical protein